MILCAVHIDKLAGGITELKILFDTILFASVCYLYTYLKENCHSKNRLLNESLFTHCPVELRQLTVTKFPWNATADAPKLTGVPPYVIMMSDLKRFEAKIDTMQDNLMDRIINQFNDRDLGGGMHNARQIHDEINKLHEEFLQISVDFRRSTGHGSGNKSNSNSESGEVPDFGYYCYEARSNILPKIFKMPTLTLASFISHYFIGNRDTGIPPL